VKQTKKWQREKEKLTN